MKNMKIIYTLFAVLFACGLSAEVMYVWKIEGKIPKGLIVPNEFIKYGLSELKTPTGEACVKVALKKVPQDKKNAWNIHIYPEMPKVRITNGSKYRYSFMIRGDRPGTLGAIAIQGQSPWKIIGNSSQNIHLDTQWQKVDVEFTSNLDFDGKVRIPMLLAGALDKDSVFHLGPITVERLENIQKLSLNPEWKLFMNSPLDNQKVASYKSIPEKIKSVSGKVITLKKNEIDLMTRLDKVFREKSPALLFNEFDVDEAGIVQIGCSADYWFKFFVNGKLVYQASGGTPPYLPTDHIFNFPVKKGRNLIVVEVLSGSQGWKFICSSVPYQANADSMVTEINRGKEWRPVKMNQNIRWGTRHWEECGLRVDDFKRIPGSALDLSQYVEKYDIDKGGFLKADTNGHLYFEKMPQKNIRLRGINMMPGNEVFVLSKEEIKEYAEQVSLAGMNVLRLHYLDKALAGLWGKGAKTWGNLKWIEDIPMAQSASEIKFDAQSLDKFYYLLKCLRDRGIYVIMDISSASGMFTGAMMARGYPRIQIFDESRYQNHWRAGFEFLMKNKNPYTDIALVNDPQIMAITLFNEQEHAFNINNGYLTRFTSEWKQFCEKEDAPEFSIKLLQEDTPISDAARKFLRMKITKMNEFYLNAVKKSGFKGFVVNWDMFMRHLEGDARSDFNAVAMHTYHAHPNIADIKVKYTQRSTRPPFWKNKVWYVGNGSSISKDSYLGRAAATRVPGKPFFLTEYSHNGYNQYSHEAGPMCAAYSSLQDWQMLTAHAGTVSLLYKPFTPISFDNAANLAAVTNTLFCTFGWQRGDIQSAKHAVSYYIPERFITSKEYLGAIGSNYSAVYMLTKIGSDYRNAKNPVATLNIIPENFVGTEYMGMWVKLDESANRNEAPLYMMVEQLRKNKILSQENKTDVAKGIFQSETGEIIANIKARTMTIDTPKLQAAVLKKSEEVKLSGLVIKSISTSCTIAAVSLENGKFLCDSKHLLIVVGTVFAAEHAVFASKNFGTELDMGEMQQVMRAGQFEFSVKTTHKKTPKVYALNFNGSRECEIPATLAGNWLSFSLDTSELKYGTPYFEVIF